MKLTILLSASAFLALTLAPPAAMSAVENPAPVCTTGETLHIKVNGLVCDFCARSVEKIFSKREEVAGITVDMDAGDIGVTLKPGQKLEDATIRQLVNDSGYEVAGIEKEC